MAYNALQLHVMRHNALVIYIIVNCVDLLR